MARYAQPIDLIREMGITDIALLMDDAIGAAPDPDLLSCMLDEECALTLEQLLTSKQLATIERALEDACDEVDGYLSSRYACPLVGNIPGTVRRWVLALASWRLWSRREAVTSAHPRRIGYEDAIAQLNGVVTGRVRLGIEPSAKAPRHFSGVLSSADRVFSQKTLKGY